MIHKLRPLIVLLVIAAIAGGGYWYFTQNPDKLTEIKVRLGLITPAEAAGIYLVSGFIEADEVSVAAETRARISELLVDEGDFVEAGQPIAALDNALLEAQIEQAAARVDTAAAQLAKVEAGVRAEEIAKAEAAVAVADAAAAAAETRWQDSITLRDNPQELDMQIDAARTSVELADLQIAANIPVKDASEVMYSLGEEQWREAYDEKRKCVHFGDRSKCVTIRMPEGVKQDAGVAWNLAGANMWESWVNLNTSFVQRDNAEARLNDLLRLRDNPQTAQVQVAQAEAAYQTAQAEVGVAQAQLKVLEAGARAEQISVAEAQVTQTEAALAALELDRDKYGLTAPMSGWVVQRIAQPGEMAAPGVSLLTLANLTDLTLTVYVPEPDVGLVSIGQEIKVMVDTFPGETFSGQVSYISPEAEFTPKNVQTREERVNTVFAVKISLDNPDQKLRPGMPADAILSESGVQNPNSSSLF
jgi:HlyD family secretion protein